MKFLGVIPARYKSSRFPGKPLADIRGKSMIQRVYEQASAAEKLDKVIVATDDKRIYQHVKDFGGEVQMTSDRHVSGTDRCAEVVESFGKVYDVVINIQGDEPFVHPVQIDSLANAFSLDTVDIATLMKRVDKVEELFNPNKVKLVLNRWKEAIYFSRHPIPYCKTADPEHWLQHHNYLKHIGMYGYRRSVLRIITGIEPTQLELAESLEQLRWLDSGYTIKAIETDLESPNIDTPEDLEEVMNNDAIWAEYL